MKGGRSGNMTEPVCCETWRNSSSGQHHELLTGRARKELPHQISSARKRYSRIGLGEDMTRGNKQKFSL
jgi:hypothetical protein